LIDNVQVHAFYDPVADLQVEQTAPGVVSIGAAATFVVTVTNAGPGSGDKRHADRHIAGKQSLSGQPHLPGQL
jgi:hypothetical protein